MRILFKWLARILGVLILAAVVVGLWKREEITRLLAVNSLFSEEKIVGNFSDMAGAFLTTPVDRGTGPVTQLPAGNSINMPEQTAQWVKDRSVTAMVVLKDGKMVHESYYLGTQPEDLRISWSVAKSYLSALMGVILDEGAIASIEDPVVKYAPSLRGGAYDGARIRDVLQMSSGITFNEDYLDYDSDINRMGRVIALGSSMDGFAQGLSARFQPPGTGWKYVSIDTHVIGMVIRGATGRNIADLLSEKVIAPMGLEAAPLYITDGYETAFVLGGLNLRTRDYARFGQMFLQQGQWNGQQIVPADWVAASTIASARTQPGETGYGYQWWMPKDARTGEYFARGIYGQYIYVDEQSQTVIAINSADRKFREEGVNDENIAMFRAIAAITP